MMGILLSILLILLIVALAICSARDLLAEFAKNGASPSLPLPLPVLLLLLLFPLASVLIATLLVVRAFSKIKRQEAEREKGDDDL